MNDIASLRARLGAVGAWTELIGCESARVERDAAREIEALGFPTLWVGEAPENKEAFAHASILLAATDTLVVATGIANIYARDALAMKLGSLAIGDAFPGRFVLGMGVSHAPLVSRRGHDYGKPVGTMRAYLEEMDAADYLPPPPEVAVPRVLGALGPKMLALAGERTAGAHPYLVPVAHTVSARAILGPDHLLAPELTVLLEPDGTRARAIVRQALGGYFAMPNYANNLRRLGYSDEELADGGSDRLIDDVIAWGSPDDIRRRVDEHLAAGADHVAVQPLATSLEGQLEQLRRLAPSLLAR
jgi:probable F420-dependent oxidoreductase